MTGISRPGVNIVRRPVNERSGEHGGLSCSRDNRRGGHIIERRLVFLGGSVCVGRLVEQGGIALAPRRNLAVATAAVHQRRALFVDVVEPDKKGEGHPPRRRVEVVQTVLDIGVLGETEFLLWTWIGLADSDILKVDLASPQHTGRDLFEKGMLNQIDKRLIEKVGGAALAGMFARRLTVCTGE